MEKLKMQSPNKVTENIAYIADRFPNCITESVDANGKQIKVVDFDMLRQELSEALVEGYEERYVISWPNKRDAIRIANMPTTDTLRPCREKSVDFDNTENLYIEGDNLKVLKILRENYLGKIKLIYIDPPYNTGKDFVYHDNFAQYTGFYQNNSYQKDEDDNQMVENVETNGRFHTDWLNMIYPRLKIARDLLSDEGAIFISISEEEIENLKKVCNEIFGEEHFINTFATRRYDKNLNRQFMNEGLKSFNVGFEYILCYAKNSFLLNPVFKEASEERASMGYWKGFWNDADRPTMRYDILGFTPQTGQWKWSKSVSDEAVENYKEYEKNYSARMTLEEYWAQTGKCKKFIRRNLKGKGKNRGVENWIAPAEGILRNTNWTDILTSKNDDSTQGLFDFPKNVDLLKLILQCATEKDSLICDFFSGSATMAHAVMQLNAEDEGKRKYIMVQYPEKTKEESEAYQAGYKTICEIGEERIRRAGKKILEKYSGINMDTGFRVLERADSNMTDVFYSPNSFTGEFNFGEDNIKSDRTAEDLLFQAMLELDVELSAKIEEKKLGGKRVYDVAEGYIMACFEKNVNESIIKEIAKEKPIYFVMRDASLATDNVADNIAQIFKAYSPETIIRIL